MLVGAFPFSYYASAGWITTTAIYLISISLGLVALYPLRRLHFLGAARRYALIVEIVPGGLRDHAEHGEEGGRQQDIWNQMSVFLKTAFLKLLDHCLLLIFRLYSNLAR